MIQAAHVAPAAAAVTPSASSLAPKVARSGEVRPRRGRPTAQECAAKGGAPIRSAPARHAVRPLRSRPASRARPEVTGGDPAAPIGCRIASTAAEAGDHSLTLGIARRRVGAARRLGAGLGSPDKSGSGGPHGPPLRETAGSPRGVGAEGEPAGRASCRWRGRRNGRRRHRSTAEPVARCRRRRRNASGRFKFNTRVGPLDHPT